MSAHATVRVDVADYPESYDELLICFDGGDPLQVSADDADRIADEIRDGAATYRSSNRIAGASASSDPRQLLGLLEERGILAPGMEAGSILSLLGELEKMEREGWRFVPPSEAS